MVGECCPCNNVTCLLLHVYANSSNMPHLLETIIIYKTNTTASPSVYWFISYDIFTDNGWIEEFQNRKPSSPISAFLRNLLIATNDGFRTIASSCIVIVHSKIVIRLGKQRPGHQVIHGRCVKSEWLSKGFSRKGGGLAARGSEEAVLVGCC